MNQQILYVLENDFVRKIKFVEDCMVLGSCSGDLFMVDMMTQELLARFKGLTKHVTALDFDGSQVAAGSTDHRVLLGSKLLGTTHVLTGHTDTVTCVSILGPNSAGCSNCVVASASVDGKLKLWDAVHGTELASHDVGDPIFCMCRTDNYLLLGCASGMVHVYTISRGKQILEFMCYPRGNVTAIEFNTKSQTFLAAEAQGRLKVFCFKTGKEIQSINAHEAPIVACQSDDSKIVSAGRDGSVAVWDRASGEVLYRVAGYTAYITSVQFDRERLVSDGTNNVIAAHCFADVDDEDNNFEEEEEGNR